MFEKLGLGIFEYLILTIVIWISILSILTIRTVRRYNKVMRSASGTNLSEVLERIVKKQETNEKVLQQISQELAKIELANRKNFQKYALIRFNPFEDTGGDQSFVLAMLDGKNNGVVVSSLHGRGGTRVYTKLVQNGESTSHQFSKEEKEVVAQAAARHE